MAQVHTKFNDNQVKELIARYIKKEVERKYIQQILGIGKTRFFALVKKYREDPDRFSIKYIRSAKNKKIPKTIEKNIIKELSIEKQFIENKDMAIKSYNYSYIRNKLIDDYNQKVSLPTIINRAKNNGFYLNKFKKKTVHDREVLTNYAGQLIQHDSSHHLWSPYAKEKWYLITSIDDYSRFMLYAILVKKETSWEHILALESVFLNYGFPHSYYIDSHSIFRFVQGRDSVWRKHHKITDEAAPQWRQVLDDCNVKPIFALSPQAKGKVERPYSWLQDHIVRTCARENVSDIRHGQEILNYERDRYNQRQVHSTTREIPYPRFQRALKEKQSLFREFTIKQPFKSTKDIFCLRYDRKADSYRKLSFNNLELKPNGVNPRDKVNMRIYFMNNGLSEIRFWCKNNLVDVKTIKTKDLNISSFQ